MRLARVRIFFPKEKTPRRTAYGIDRVKIFFTVYMPENCNPPRTFLHISLSLAKRFSFSDLIKLTPAYLCARS